MKVVILDDSVRSFDSKDKNDKPVTHKFQEIFVFWEGQRFPRPCSLYAVDHVYPPGEYELDVEKSVKIQNEKLVIRDLVLRPLKVSNAGPGPADKSDK